MSTLLANPPEPATHSAGLTDLIAGVRRVVESEANPRQAGLAVANLLRPWLGRSDFLRPEQMAPGGECYRQHILHVEPDGRFSVVALVWLPGQSTPIHDHVSWCVVGVHRGEEHETVYELQESELESHLVKRSHSITPLGTVVALVPPGDIHHVENGGDELAVSLHIYGADIGKLGSSIRRRYHLAVQHSADRQVE